MLELNDLLHKAGIEPADVLVMRHRPKEPTLRRVFGWIAAERPELYKAYQSSQFVRAEKSLSRAKYMVSLVGLIPARAVFVALYQVGEAKFLTREEFWSIPENKELASLGMIGWSTQDNRSIVRRFNLREIESMQEFSGRLEIGWTGGERSWFRWAVKNCFPIMAIHEASVLSRHMPDWTELVLGYNELKALPSSWAARLSEWRGIYLIVDKSDGRGYVGSAYGAENILGRWRQYAQTGHGGNLELRGRDPENFLFSILQRVSPDMDADDVIRLEGSWKERLHTRRLGLNKN